jgi:hypothetical protein
MTDPRTFRYEAMEALLPLCDKLESQLKHDLEIHGGLKVIHRLAASMHEKMKPLVQKYGEKKKYGKSVVEKLIKDVFP